MTNFPATLDTFANPTAGTTMDAAGFEHDVQHSNLNDAVAALQAKVGITGSADANSLDNKIAALQAAVAALVAGTGAGIVGAGSPQGVQAANPGIFYWDTVGKSIWIKDTGTGNTGWLQLIA